MVIPPKNSLSFFNSFDKDTSSNKMNISPAYTLHMLGTLPQRVSLRDKYGNLWPMKLANIENELYFKNGWAKFVEDNSIETGDVLFFQYNDDKVFDVKIIGINGCEKKGVGGPKSKGKEPIVVEIIDEEKEVVSVEEIEEQEHQSLDEEFDKEMQESDDEEMQESDNEELEKEDQLFEKEIERLATKMTKQALARKVEKPKSKGISGGSKKSNRAKNLVPEKDGAKRKRAKAPDCYGVAIFKSGILPQPKNPFFVTKIRPKRRRQLYVPIEWLKDSPIERLPDKTVIRDSSGRTWPTSIKTWQDGRKFYVGGWSSFCKVNLVGDDDLCICEFVKEGDQKDLVIQVQVVPNSNNAMA